MTINLMIKESWRKEKSKEIADAFGFVNDERFNLVLNEFISTTAEPAKHADYLQILAKKVFDSVEPPLTRKSSNV